MRAAVLHAPGDIRIEDVPVPKAKAGELLLRVAAVGVCGSDIPRVLTKGTYRMPMICGHEFSGRVAEIGPGVEGFERDQLVAVAPLIACHQCDQCRRGQYSRCLAYDYFGSRRDGAYAEYVTVPVGNVLPTPDGIHPVAVAMTDPASVALHAVWKAGGMTIGRRGGVVGCGPIGLFAIQWMRLMGASEVVAVDVSEGKLAMAREAGATHTILSSDPVPSDLPCDLVVEAVGLPSTISVAIRMAGPGGHASFIGIPTAAVEMDNATFQHFLRQEISLHGSWNSFGAPFPGDQWTVTLNKLASGALKWKFMVTHDLDLAELPAMYQKFKNKTEFFSKVIFRP